MIWLFWLDAFFSFSGTMCNCCCPCLIRELQLNLDQLHTRKEQQFQRSHLDLEDTLLLKEEKWRSLKMMIITTWDLFASQSWAHKTHTSHHGLQPRSFHPWCYTRLINMIQWTHQEEAAMMMHCWEDRQQCWTIMWVVCPNPLCRVLLKSAQRLRMWVQNWHL